MIPKSLTQYNALWQIGEKLWITGFIALARLDTAGHVEALVAVRP
jgi:hypothetical protein